MKILKKPIFMFLLGVFAVGTIGVVAVNINANDINYGNGTVKDALDDLYGAATCQQWTEIQGATVVDASYVYNNSLHLYKCGNTCKLSFDLGSTNINTDYRLITDSRYYPEENVTGYGIGRNSGYIEYTLKTDGNIMINSQSIKDGGWASDANVAYLCK